MSIVAAIVSLMGAIISGVLATIITLTINHKSEIIYLDIDFYSIKTVE